MDKSEIVERFLLLHNNACCGIIRQTDESNLLMVMSPSGQHVHIYHAGNHYKHLTRFVPMRFEEAIGRMILFRNTHSLSPYLCSRYNSISNNSIPDIDNLFMIATCDTPRNIRLYLCPLLERIYCIQQYFVKNDDTCIEHELKTTASNGILVSEVVHVYPIQSLPESIQLLIISIIQNKQHINEANRIYMNSTESAVQAIELLDTVMTYMSVLSNHNNHNRYLNTLPCHISTEEDNHNHKDNISKYATLSMAESVDGDVYIVSSYPSTTKTNREKSVHLQYDNAISTLKTQYLEQQAQCVIEETEEAKENNTEQLQVEVWLKSTSCSSCSNSGSSSTNTNICTGKDDIIIRLCGDYFTFIYTVVAHHTTAGTSNADTSTTADNTQQHTIIKRKKLHISFIQYELQKQAKMYDINAETNEIIWTEHDEELYKNNNNTTTGNTSSTYTNNTEEKNVYILLHKYYKQLVRLLYYREHILERQRQGFDSSLRNPMRETSTDSSSCSIGTTSGCRNISTTATTTSGRDTLTNVIRKDYPDGSAYTALLRTCHTSQEADSYQLSLLHIPNHLHTNSTSTSSSGSTLNYRRELLLPCQCVAQINAVFPDHTILKFQVITQIFHIIFANGEECQFSLGSYKRQEGIFASHPCIPTRSNAYYSDTPVKRNKKEFNINKIIQYIHHILAFYRWANTPVELRSQLEEHDRRNVLLARSSALKTHRYLISNEIANGNLTVLEANAKTKAFLARLDGIEDSGNDRNIVYNHYQCVQSESAYTTPIRPTATTNTGSSSRINHFYPLPVDPVTYSTVRTVRQGSTIGSSHTAGISSAAAEAVYQSSAVRKGSPNSNGHTEPYPTTINIVTPDSAAIPIAVESYRTTATAATTPVTTKMNVITPEYIIPKNANNHYNSTPAAAVDIIHSAADHRAGTYIHSNVSIHPRYSSFGRPTTTKATTNTTVPRSAVVTPPSNRTNNNNLPLTNIHNTYIPHTRQDFPQYVLPVEQGTTKYLSATYIKDVLNTSTKLLASHREYLSNVHTTTIV